MNNITINGAWIIALPAILMALDIITGFLCGLKQKKIDSSKMRAGFFKKIGELIMLVTVMMLCAILGLNKALGVATSLYLIVTELISLTENLDYLGVKVPSFLKDILNKANEVK